LIGIEPRDPYGRIITDIFARARLQYQAPIKARFGVTVCALVRQNLGIGVIDGFTLAEQNRFGLRVIPIEEDTSLRTYVAFRNDATLSSVAEFFIAALRTRTKKAHEHANPPPTSAASESHIFVDQDTSRLLKNSFPPQFDSVPDSVGFRCVHGFDPKQRAFSTAC
jgi:hypothetical protein